jgi:small subunit ribosomal protein S14
MSMFRSKKLDLGCFVNIKVIRDHTKRKVFAEHEPERYDRNPHTRTASAHLD